MNSFLVYSKFTRKINEISNIGSNKRERVTTTSERANTQESSMITIIEENQSP